MKKNKILLIICSGGGHLTEANYALKRYKGKRILLSNCNFHEVKFNKTDLKYIKIINPHKNYLLYFLNFIQVFFIYLRYKPKIIFSTGAGIALPMCIIGKILGSKIIFLESACRIKELSASGKFMYRLADKFIVQWECLLKDYPKAIYQGGLI